MKHLVLAMTMATALCTTTMAQSQVKNVYASSEKLNMEMLQDAEQTVQLNRYLFAGYNTLCLPMTLNAEQLGDIKVERLAAIQQEGNVLNLYFVDCTAEGIQAGVPYLVYSPKSQYLRIKNSDAISIDTQLKAVRMSDNAGNTIIFSSHWETMAKDGLYGIPAKQDVTPLESVLIRTKADKSFLPTRCGFSWEEQAPSAQRLCIVHASMTDVTAIKNINLQTTSNTAYDLGGRKLSNQGKKGIVVSEGKKVLVK